MLVVAAACALPLLACGGGRGGPDVVSDSTYVEVMARLVLLDSAMTSPTDVPLGGLDRDSARRLVLRRHGVEADDLLRFAEERGRSPEAMAEIWVRVQELGDSLEASDWRPGAEAAVDSGGAPDRSGRDSAPPPDPASDADAPLDSVSGGGDP